VNQSIQASAVLVCQMNEIKQQEKQQTKSTARHSQSERTPGERRQDNGD
jgi:hypothetical protein